ncbi:MAG: hypothetical protein WDO13_03400 [Verrucomicrobiota bacterium]
MRHLAALALLLAPALLHADDLRPDASGAPLFVVYPLASNESDSLTLDRDKPLMSVESVSSFMLESDKRRVRVVLNDEDAKLLTQILRDFHYVGITAGESTAVLSGTRFSGSLIFDNPVAAVLRRRFHIKPGTNDVVPPPANPFAPPAL